MTVKSIKQFATLTDEAGVEALSVGTNGTITTNHSDSGTGDLNHLTLQKQGNTRFQIGSNQGVGVTYQFSATGYGHNFLTGTSGGVGGYSSLGAWTWGAASGGGSTTHNFRTGAGNVALQLSTGSTGKWQFGFDTNFGTDGFFFYEVAGAKYTGGCSTAGAWTLGPTSGSAVVTHKLVGTNNTAGTPVVHLIKNGVVGDASGNSYLECYASSSTFDGYLGVSGTTLQVIDASDSRKKENVREATFGLTEVNALRPVLFDWKEEYGGVKNVKGFLAQEVESVLSECVTTQDESIRGGFVDSKFLATGNMIPVLVAAIQQLSAKVDSLQSEINTLKGA
jgi:Chaperone of endosialidase